MSRSDRMISHTGHSRLTQGFMLDWGSPPGCVGCDAQYGIRHILVDCVYFAHVWQRFYIVNTGDAIIKYLIAIGLPYKK